MAIEAEAGPVWAVGLMCGTSMDGVDAAALCSDGVEIAAFGPAMALSPAYREAERAELMALGAALAEERVSPEAARSAPIARAVDRIHAAAALALAPQLSEPPALLGYHGQTVWHAPERGVTVQLGDGAWLAATAGVDTVWDFRTADVAAGGQGAPLAPAYHWALARWLGAQDPLVFLNIGGVANLTWVDPQSPAPDAPGAVLAFDTGPGNALIDDLIRARTGAPCDLGGAIAAAGRPERLLARSNAAAAYIARPGPKSLDRNAFRGVMGAVEGLSTEAAAASLTALTADCITAAQAHLPGTVSRWLVCGGGRYNRALMGMLADRLPAPVEPVDADGIDGDMLEAQAFAYLALRAARGLPISAPGTTGCAAPTLGGRLARA